MKNPEPTQAPVGPDHPLVQQVLPFGLGYCYERDDRREGPFAAAYLVTAPVPSAGLLPGDILFDSHMAAAQIERCCRGRARRLPRRDYPVVAELLGTALTLIASSWRGPHHRDPAKRMLSMHRRWITCGKQWKDASSPFVIVRPFNAPVSEPIAADSDQAAIFELLASVGCRMPKGSGRNR